MANIPLEELALKAEVGFVRKSDLTPVQILGGGEFVTYCIATDKFQAKAAEDISNRVSEMPPGVNGFMLGVAFPLDRTTRSPPVELHYFAFRYAER